ncbi:S1-like domain-containing RNA-binding protein [Arcobacter sp. KX21116]|jgi:predicted RNA-binding protein (virulence factor B family)|uniref:CvfB family protein n=1 Tax=Arcobacter iocasae TaxID=2906515 RepID=UPI0035D424FB|tara:strand:+ start:24043 stop:24891 length:849 start_codon:yes stop_codon:yes gene_type:complete
MTKLNEKIELGVMNTLKVNRLTEPGIYLEALDEEVVLLPNAYIRSDMEIGTLVDVFIYTDSEDRLVATTLKPYAMKNEYACLEVVDTAKFGAFVDIGLPKDLLVPINRQTSTFNVGARKVLRVIEDEKTQRLIATEKFTQFLSKDIVGLEKNDEVMILLFSKTPLGYKVIVNNLYEGMIFHTEIFENTNIGDLKKAYIKNIRDDGKLDLSLQKIGQKKSGDNSQKVLEVLKENNGKINFTYKSEAEDIMKAFAMSKKAFKAALTELISKEKIRLEDNYIQVK